MGPNGTAGPEQVVQPWVGVLAATALLLVCLLANGLVIEAVRRKGLPVPRNHRRDYLQPCNVEKLVCLIAAVGVLNGCWSCIFQIVSFLVHDRGMFSETFCKVQGLATNLMSLLIIWYQALLGFERYLKFVKPQEYDITFSKMNMQIMLFGISFILLSAVSGPIYGWGNYAYMPDIHSCTFDLKALNAVTYFVLSSLSYVVTPYAIMAYSCFSILLNAYCCARRLDTSMFRPPDPWSSLQRHDVVLPLSLTVVTSFLLQIPKYKLDIEQALDPVLGPPPTYLLFAATWLQTFAINCCFPCLLLSYHVCQTCIISKLSCAAVWKTGVVSTIREADEEPVHVSLKHKGSRRLFCPCWLAFKKQKQPQPILLTRLPTI